MTSKKKELQVRKVGTPKTARNLLADLRDMIETSRQTTATTGVRLRWHPCCRIPHSLTSQNDPTGKVA